ncbi:hypothetical protein M5K25_013145 [Dendrobium thyrsiflorum]|uniref:Uncharacterized protein n=1 Tax=Dendrobium thyrsiflorum TaxID=117978 RepID=A0ABD0UZI1_DENTH
MSIQVISNQKHYNIMFHENYLDGDDKFKNIDPEKAFIKCIEQDDVWKLGPFSDGFEIVFEGVIGASSSSHAFPQLLSQLSSPSLASFFPPVETGLGFAYRKKKKNLIKKHPVFRVQLPVIVFIRKWTLFGIISLKLKKLMGRSSSNVYIVKLHII